MSELAMIVSSTALPGKRQEVFDLYLEHLAPRAEANDDQHVVIWCADQQDDDVFHLIEVYRSAEAMGANAQAPWFAAYMEQAMSLLAAQPQVHMATPQWSKGIPTA